MVDSGTITYMTPSKYEFFLEFWILNAQLSKIMKTLLISSCSFMYGKNKIWNFLKISLKKPQKTRNSMFSWYKKNKSIKWNSWIFSYKFQNFTNIHNLRWTNNLALCLKKVFIFKKKLLCLKKIKNSRDNFLM